MDEPDVKIAKIIAGIITLVFFALPVFLVLKYLSISSQCSYYGEYVYSIQEDVQPKQPSNSTRTILIVVGVIVVLSSLAAQAINHSYPISKFRARN